MPGTAKPGPDYRPIVKGNLLVTKMLLALGAVSLASPAQSSPPYVAKAAVQSSRPSRLEGMGYLAARRIILGYGWEPVTGSCLENASECAGFPEIHFCSGVAPGYCGMAFRRRNRCLYVGTSGGQPIAGEESDAHVIDVVFRRGPCLKY